MILDISDIAIHNLKEFSVSEISSALKKTIEDTFGYVRIKGEISGFKKATSGHLYFSLKDENALISAVCWRGVFLKIPFAIEDGVEVIITGKITTYAGRSNYQIIAEKIELAGKGQLMILFQKLKEKLLKEGLFEAQHKKPIPKFPKIIGVVTSPTGAVIQDIIHRISERFPLKILVYSVLVQGEGAKEQIANAIDKFNLITDENLKPDVLIVARGGGSAEDLWAFNEEIVVRSIFASKIPIISAVGHETDTTLSDFVADLRSPTPTAAAEIATPVRLELLNALSTTTLRLNGNILSKLNEKTSLIKATSKALKSPKVKIENLAQRLDYAGEKNLFAIKTLLTKYGKILNKIAEKVLSPNQQISLQNNKLNILSSKLEKAFLKNIHFNEKRQKLENNAQKIKSLTLNKISNIKQSIIGYEAILNALSYKNVLQRGYSVIKDEDGKIITSSSLAKTKNTLLIELRDGSLKVSNSKN